MNKLKKVMTTTVIKYSGIMIAITALHNDISINDDSGSHL